jgi:hypothetical protein
VSATFGQLRGLGDDGETVSFFCKGDLLLAGLIGHILVAVQNDLEKVIPLSEKKQIDFLVNLQRLLEEGQFVASYKFALPTRTRRSVR